MAIRRVRLAEDTHLVLPGIKLHAHPERGAFFCLVLIITEG